MAGKDGYRKIKILIASPSDVSKERDIAEKVIGQWNIVNSDERKLTLEAVLWESHSAPESGDRIQGILNTQIVDACDAAIGIFWTRIGTHTGVAQGGAVEEIERLEKNGKPVMIYFSLDDLPHDVDVEQLQNVRAFKARRQCKGDYLGEYKNPEDFRMKLTRHLGVQVGRWFLGEKKDQVTSDSTNEHLKHDQLYQSTLTEELGKIRLIGSPDIDSVQVNLDDTFVPLRISHNWKTEDRFKTGKRDDALQEEMRHHTPDELMQRVFSEYRMLLVIGDPGSGKTTLMKYYALCCLQNNQDRLFGRQLPVRVFYLPLRDLKRSESGDCLSLPEQLSLWAGQRSNSIDREVFETWLRDKKTQSLVLFDGLDEISDLEKRKEACNWIDRTWSGFSDAYFVVTSRFTGYRKVEGVELSADHIRADVMDFSFEQQEEFLSKWFTAAYLRDLCPAGINAGQWMTRQKNDAKDRTAKIVEYLNKEKNRGLRELAAIPMMLQIMAILWKERDFLPDSRLKLYSAALDYLLEYRDERRKIPPLLPADKARRVLAPVSLWMQQELKADEVERIVMHEKMQETLDTFDHPPSAKDFCRNLVDRAGLLAEYGDRDYVFRHKTFREYLAGSQLVEKAKRTTGHIDSLVKHFGEDWWNEVMKFFMGQADAEMFDHFMGKLFNHPLSEELSSKQQTLLDTLIEEAPQKKTDALCDKLLDTKTTVNQQRYILDCLKAIGKPTSAEAVTVFLDSGLAKEKEGIEKAGELLKTLGAIDDEQLSILLRKAQVKISPEEVSSASFRNPCEHDAQYILIPGGKYRYSVRKKKVTVPDLYVAKYPVTNRQYRSFIDFLAGKPAATDATLSLKSYQESLHDLAGSKDDAIKGFQEYLKKERNLADRLRSRHDVERKFNKDDQPVVGVSWYAARAYCLWLTMLAGDKAEYRLPTEVEWEWAAGGRRDKPGEVLEVRKYPWGDEPDPTAKHANYGSNEGATTPVGRYLDGATPEGLYDIAGNVWEWMENWCDEEKRNTRAVRGGSWYDAPENLACSSWVVSNPDYRSYGNGFRVVRPPVK